MTNYDDLPEVPDSPEATLEMLQSRTAPFSPQQRLAGLVSAGVVLEKELTRTIEASEKEPSNVALRHHSVMCQFGVAILYQLAAELKVAIAGAAERTH